MTEYQLYTVDLGTNIKALHANFQKEKQKSLINDCPFHGDWTGRLLERINVHILSDFSLSRSELSLSSTKKKTL